MEQYSTVRYWIEDLPKRGRNVFSQQEAESQFPNMSLDSIRSSLYRLVKKGKIQSVWHGFFVIITFEYGLKGIVPPIEYIDHLMKHLGKQYYVCLLSAAELQGAAHQQPMEFYVITNSGNLRDKTKKDTKINFITKKNIPAQYVTQVMVSSGYVNVSIPELTAFDLIVYARNVGGIVRVATILSELAEVLDFEKIDAGFLKSYNAAIIQRLGYLLDILGFTYLADMLERKANEAGLKFKKQLLSVVSKGKNLSGYETDKRWKIIINVEIDIDEL